MTDRSVNFSGQAQMGGVISTGENASIVYKNTDDSKDIFIEFKEIFERLSGIYADAQDNQKQIVLQMKIQKKLKNDPTFKKRFINAAKAGSIELVKIVTNNPFVSVPIETVKGWIETE